VGEGNIGGGGDIGGGGVAGRDIGRGGQWGDVGCGEGVGLLSLIDHPQSLNGGVPHSGRKPQAFSIINVGDLWHKTGDAPAVVLSNMALEELLLNKVMEVFVGKVDGKLIEGIGREVRF
jgi:hypothetical protein